MRAITEEVVLGNMLSQSCYVESTIRLQNRTYRSDIKESQYNDDGASGDQKTPTGHTKSALTKDRFIEIPKQGDANREHGETQGDEAVTGTEKWPCSSKVGWKQREFRDDEEHCCCE